MNVKQNLEQQIAAAWNAQADEFNQWDELDFEEKIEWAAKWGASQQSRAQELQVQLAAVQSKDYQYFSYDPEVGIEFHNTEAEAIKRCEELLQVYRKEAYSDGWYEEVEALRWGVVLGLAVKVDERPAPEGSEFECLCDYTLQSVAEPVAWVAADTLNSPHPGCVSSLSYMSQLDKDRDREYVPLYAAPLPTRHPGAKRKDREDALEAENMKLREALKELITWIPSADTYRRLGFDPEAPMQAYEAVKAALVQGEV